MMTCVMHNAIVLHKVTTLSFDHRAILTLIISMLQMIVKLKRFFDRLRHIYIDAADFKIFGQ